MEWGKRRRFLKSLAYHYLECCEAHDIFQNAVKYFERKKISYEMLADELRDDFSEIHCISVNDDKTATENQILLNSLEDTKNPYCAITDFEDLRNLQS